MSECTRLGSTLACIDILQPWNETLRRRLGVLSFLLTRKPPVDSVLSKPSSILFILITKLVFDFLLEVFDGPLRRGKLPRHGDCRTTVTAQLVSATFHGLKITLSRPVTGTNHRELFCPQP